MTDSLPSRAPQRNKIASSDLLVNLTMIFTGRRIPGSLYVWEMYLVGHFGLSRLLIAGKPVIYGFMWHGWLDMG